MSQEGPPRYLPSASPFYLYGPYNAKDSLKTEQPSIRSESSRPQPDLGPARSSPTPDASCGNPFPCDPRVVSVRFDVIHGSPIAQHSLTDFDNGLLREARGYQPEISPMVDEKCGLDGSGSLVGKR
jgi:hypothetical protein